jgi:hypothetical protein
MAMNEQKQPPASPVEPSSVDPDELVAHIGRLSITGTSLISAAFHVLLIGLTSIGFISLCVRHRTLHPKAVLNRLAEEQRQAEKAAARSAARQKALQEQAKKPRATTRPKSPIEKKITETSREKPTPTKLNLDGLER